LYFYLATLSTLARKSVFSYPTDAGLAVSFPEGPRLHTGLNVATCFGMAWALPSPTCVWLQNKTHREPSRG
jgi:hypothetical protein